MIMRKFRRALGLGLALLLVLSASPLLAADWRDEIKVFRIGVLADSDPAYRLVSLEPFRAYLEERLGIPVGSSPRRATPR